MLYMEHVPFITGIQDYEKALGITLLFSTSKNTKDTNI